MSSATHDPFRLPVRVLALIGGAALAALTLVDQGATRMYATPWNVLLTVALFVPPLLLLVRLLAGGPTFQRPAAPWLMVAIGAVVIPVLSALASPYPGPSLLAARVPLAAACLFFLLHDWLNGPDNAPRIMLERILAAAAAVCGLVSTAGWLADLRTLDRATLFSQTIFEMRNPHPLGHSNYTAGLMLLGLPWLARLAWRNCGALRIAATLGLMHCLLALFTSGSRGGLLGLAALVIGGLAVSGLGWKRIVLFSGGGLLLAGLLAVSNPRIRDLLGPRDPLSEPNLSTVQRSAMIEAGRLMGTDRPLLGWGPGSTPLVYPRYRSKLQGGADNVLQLHNTPLSLWAETGSAGLLLALGLAGLVFLGRHRSPVAAAALAGYGVFALTDYQLDVPVFAAAVATLTALLSAKTQNPPAVVTRRTFAFALVITAGLIVALGESDPAPELNARGLLLGREEKTHDQAVALLRQSLALDPDQEIAHFNLGWLLLVPEPARAEKHFLSAAHLVPDKGGVYFGLGLARLNQGRAAEASRAFALECVNDPRFVASPWWTVPEIAALREATGAEFTRMLASLRPALDKRDPWVERQIALLTTLAPRLGQVSPGPEASYRRERIGYPVLMRNLDIAPPLDLYDVREDPRFPDSVPFTLPPKGWLPTPMLLKLLDESLLSAH